MSPSPFMSPSPDPLPQGRGLLRDRALLLALSKGRGLGEGRLTATCFIHQNNIDLPLVFMVLLGRNCFMQIVDMKIDKSFLHRHSG